MRALTLVFGVEEEVDGQPAVLIGTHKVTAHFSDHDIADMRKLAAGMGFEMPLPDNGEHRQKIAQWLALRRSVADKLEAATVLVHRFLLPRVMELLGKSPQ